MLFVLAMCQRKHLKHQTFIISVSSWGIWWPLTQGHSKAVVPVISCLFWKACSGTCVTLGRSRVLLAHGPVQGAVYAVAAGFPRARESGQHPSRPVVLLLITGQSHHLCHTVSSRNESLSIHQGDKITQRPENQETGIAILQG